MSYYASFDFIYDATHINGNTFAIDGSITATAIKLYPVNPQVNPTNTGTFVSTGSAQSVWLEYVDASSTTHLIECTLTNGAERVNGGAEDVWVFRQNGTTTYFVLTSGGYVAASSETINSSIRLGSPRPAVGYRPLP